MILPAILCRPPKIFTLRIFVLLYLQLIVLPTTFLIAIIIYIYILSYIINTQSCQFLAVTFHTAISLSLLFLEYNDIVIFQMLQYCRLYSKYERRSTYIALISISSQIYLIKMNLRSLFSIQTVYKQFLTFGHLKLLTGN